MKVPLRWTFRNHLHLQGITGSKMEKACDICHITVNKNAVVGDVSAMAPGGVRIGAPAMSSRGLKEQDFEQIANMLHDVLEVCKRIQAKHGKLLKDFNKWDNSPSPFPNTTSRLGQSRGLVHWYNSCWQLHMDHVSTLSTLWRMPSLPGIWEPCCQRIISKS